MNSAELELNLHRTRGMRCNASARAKAIVASRHAGVWTC